MKETEKERRYNEALERARKLYETCDNTAVIGWCEHIFPELKESEDEKIRKTLIKFFSKGAEYNSSTNGISDKDILAWLEKHKYTEDDLDKAYKCADEVQYRRGYEDAKKEIEKQGDNPTPINIDKMVMEYSQTKDSDFGLPVNCMIRAYRKGIIDVLNLSSGIEKQGDITKLSEEEQNRFAKGVLSSCAMSFIDYLDAHKNEGKMCVSNGECVDIENAFHNSMWDRLHRYYCKYIEKQDSQNLANSTKTCEGEPKFHEGEWVTIKE